MSDTERPDRIVILRRGDLRLAIPLLDVTDPTPTGLIISALPTLFTTIAQAPPGADTGAPLSDDADGVLMLRVVGDEQPLIPDVGLVEQTPGKWSAGGPDGAGRTDLTARVPELEVDLVDVDRPAIYLHPRSASVR